MLLHALLVTLPVLPAGGFDRGIQIAQARTVKLYGLGAGMQKGYGSGILVSPDGQVLTVLTILVDSTNIRAVTADGRRYTATVVARDAGRQMALLQLVAGEGDGSAAPAGLPCFPVADSQRSPPLRTGDWVIAAGNAFNVAQGAEPASVALGVFSGRTRLHARRRRQDYPYRGDVLLIDAITANPGAPGGPLVDLEGNLVGMVGRVVVSSTTRTQLNHAFPLAVCQQFLSEARQPADEGDREPPGWQQADVRPTDLGIKLFEMGYRKKLVFVESVRPASPAAEAGLKGDDLIVSADGRSVPDVEAFRRVLAELRPGDRLHLVALREEEHVDIIIEVKGADDE